MLSSPESSPSDPNPLYRAFKRKRLPLCARILIIVAASLAPCLAIVILSATRIERSVLERTMQSCRYVAASLASQELILLRSVAQMMAGTAEAPPIRDGNPGEAAVILAPVRRTNQYFLTMSLYEESGKLIAGSEGACSGLARSEAIGRLEGFTLDRAEPCRGILSLIARMLVRRWDGGSGGYLEAGIDAIASLDETALSEIPSGAIIEIADREGRSLYRSDKAAWTGRMDENLADLARRASAGRIDSATLSDGTEVLVSVAGVDGDGDGRADLLLCVRLDRDKALAALRVIMRDTYLVIVSVAVLALAIALILTQVSILSDVRGILARVSRVGISGGGGTRRDPGKGDELRALSEALDRLDEVIVDRESALILRQEELRTARDERDALLREVHHRVYNNLQVVLSLIRLKEGAVREGEALLVLKETRRRILSMSLAHSALYGSATLSRIDFCAYARDIMNSQLEDFPGLRSRVALVTQIEAIDLDIGKAIPLGLILNELLANCLTHAFPGRTTGTITIGLARAGEGRAELSVADDGIGFSGIRSGGDGRKLGLLLAEGMASQLGGAFGLDSPGRGTKAVVSFPAA